MKTFIKFEVPDNYWDELIKGKKKKSGYPKIFLGYLKVIGGEIKEGERFIYVTPVDLNL